MQLNWMSNTYWQSEGYGRYSAHMAHALLRAGADVHPILRDHITMPEWMARRAGLDWSRLTIACIPPYYLPDYAFPGRLWLLTMTEGGEVPDGWADYIHGAGVERVIVPCQHNRKVFANALDVPVHVVPGGTDPYQFPITPPAGNEHYTFLALADRGARKGWVEVWEAFYQEFGRPQDTPDVRLVIKTRPDSNDLVSRIAPATTDPRIEFWEEDVAHPSAIWQRADCVVIPSRSEGWGMPHREAAMMGRPVIATRYSGLDDGHTHEWALVVENGRLERISLPQDSHIKGDWQRADVDEIGQLMKRCYLAPELAWEKGQQAAAWLRANQTWDEAGAAMLALLEEYA